MISSRESLGVLADRERFAEHMCTAPMGCICIILSLFVFSVHV